jgi:hypothetical protein
MLCINQGNIQKRGHQVKDMKQVFSNGALVVVWLGGRMNGDADIFAPLHHAFPSWHISTEPGA